MVAAEYKEIQDISILCDSCATCVRQYFYITTNGKYTRLWLCVQCYNDNTRTKIINGAALVVCDQYTYCFSCSQYGTSNPYTLIFDTSEDCGSSMDVCLICLTTNMRAVINKVRELSHQYVRDIVELIGYRHYTPGQRYIELLRCGEHNGVKIERMLLYNDIPVLPKELIGIVLSYYWIYEE